MAAHGDTGVLELVESVPVDDDSVTYVVELTFESDGDPVSGTDVTVVLDDAAPQPMTSDGEGIYRATVDFPTTGEHTVRFTAEEPTAELTIDQLVTTTTTTAVDAQATTTTSGAPALAADHDDANGTWLLIVMAVLVVAMVTLALAFVRGRRRA